VTEGELHFISQSGQRVRHWEGKDVTNADHQVVTERGRGSRGGGPFGSGTKGKSSFFLEGKRSGREGEGWTLNVYGPSLATSPDRPKKKRPRDLLVKEEEFCKRGIARQTQRKQKKRSKRGTHCKRKSGGGEKECVPLYKCRDLRTRVRERCRGWEGHWLSSYSARGKEKLKQWRMEGKGDKDQWFPRYKSRNAEAIGEDKTKEQREKNSRNLMSERKKHKPGRGREEGMPHALPGSTLIRRGVM